MAPKKPRATPAEPLMHGIYCHRYYEKNREQVNNKTRERMRRLRASDVTVSPEVLAARLETRRAAARRYRERHQHRLKMKAREARAEAAERKAGTAGAQGGSAAASGRVRPMRILECAGTTLRDVLRTLRALYIVVSTLIKYSPFLLPTSIYERYDLLTAPILALDGSFRGHYYSYRWQSRPFPMDGEQIGTPILALDGSFRGHYYSYRWQSRPFATDGEQTETRRLIALRAALQGEEEENLRQEEELRQREADWVYVFFGALRIVMAQGARPEDSLR
ncbi:hypothetical protein B0H11DRAFT_2229141 [Mycena galericulata]|nr:hypothetical protein B0H11DRAFT_2229141 [Mycena galericulata]